ncbi:ATP-dependent DNA helicase DinG [Ornithinibacillus sp. L9]|uniref:3'-5' exonuclease DinG n=1 Tax=Ornithinibacillus caprae TaxID=2678566 RepID=A0A6N8FDM9_9BACI|nr:ATP-dependent DNA helicase DinG [Ornithinibacillus caprae]MUK87291.1 ATP-dependent DNA helicase DinG [Ornithinibacillus caprae]
MDRYVVIDLETTGNITNNDQIIEVGIVVIEGNNIIDEYSTLLRPNKPIPPFISKLTGISDSDVEFAPVFEEVAGDIVELFRDSYLIAHNVPFDLGFLNSELELFGMNRLKNPVLDTVELTRILFPQAPSYKLNQLAEYFKITHEDPHRALSDAYVTANLFLKLKQKVQSLPLETIKHLIKLEKTLKSDVFELFQKQQDHLMFTTTGNSFFESYKGLAIRSIDYDVDPEELPVEPFGEYLDQIYEPNGTMEKVLHHYEKRVGQREMSEYIYDAFQMRKHAIIEAETGTGKSVAYLLPAVYEAKKKNQRIMISTYTTQLQAQLLEEEIPMIEKLISFPINVALLKGRQHYIDVDKFAKTLRDNQQDNYDVTLTKAMILVWLTETITGDIDELHLPSSGYLFYEKISSDIKENGSVPTTKYSFYHLARKKAQVADILITNHALLCSDIFNEYQLLPTYEKIIIDEAHHLEETASRHYGLKLDYVNVQHTLNRIGAINADKWIDEISITDKLSLESWNDLLSKTKYEVDDLFRTLFKYVLVNQANKHAHSDIGRIQYRFTEEDFGNKKWNVIKEMTNRIIFYCKEQIRFLTQIGEKAQEDDTDLISSIKKLQTLVEQLQHLFIYNSTEDFVNWIEIEANGAKNAVYVYSEPRDISKTMEKLFFREKESIILTSATLTMKNSFSFIKQRLGVPLDRLVTKKIQSPFSYQDQVRLMVPNDFPDIKTSNIDDFVFATCEAILSLAEITNGRMMILFTSYDMLKRAYELIREMMVVDEYVLIAQGITSGSRSRLKKNFQTFDQAILFGTSSFWEGVDIPGDDLSCLMIVRLPFQPPHHPVYEAKANYLQAHKKNPFYELALPNAVIRFKQGFGRLIRSATDRGIVFVCDARIVKASYGKYFTDSIPDVPIAHKSTAKLMEQAKKWF